MLQSTKIIFGSEMMINEFCGCKIVKWSVGKRTIVAIITLHPYVSARDATTYGTVVKKPRRETATAAPRVVKKSGGENCIQQFKECPLLSWLRSCHWGIQKFKSCVFSPFTVVKQKSSIENLYRIISPFFLSDRKVLSLVSKRYQSYLFYWW